MIKTHCIESLVPALARAGWVFATVVFAAACQKNEPAARVAQVEVEPKAAPTSAIAACAKDETICDEQAICFPVPAREAVRSGAAVEACDKGDASACAGAGVTHLFGVGRPKDATRAAAAFKRGCESGEVASCFNEMRARERKFLPKPPSTMEAFAVYEKACAAGVAEACAATGVLTEFELAKDPKAPIRWYERACELGSSYGCVRLAYHLGYGIGVERDEEKMFSLYDRTCRCGDDRGCAGKAAALIRGLGTPADPSTAQDMLSGLCDRGNFGACANLGYMLETGKAGARDLKAAAVLYEKACEHSMKDAEGVHGCYRLGRMFSEGIGREKDEPRAAALFEQACALSHPTACATLGWWRWEGRGGAKDERQAVELFEKACTRGDKAACVNLGARYYRGQVVPRDIAKATELFRTACEEKFAKGCDSQGLVASEAGDDASATEWFERACKGGSKQGCEHLAETLSKMGNLKAADEARGRGRALKADAVVAPMEPPR